MSMPEDNVIGFDRLSIRKVVEVDPLFLKNGVNCGILGICDPFTSLRRRAYRQYCKSSTVSET